jgi:hypothetical protein
MTSPGKLTVGTDGRLRGQVRISYNTPFPCVNGRWGSGAMRGVIMHTMVGNLPSAIDVFNNPAKEASAFFGIAQDGSVHQFGPVGKGWIAYAQVDGNDAWYSIEHADDENPDNPLTDAQLNASAQIVEALSAFARFPLQVTNSVTGRGYGVHNMGGVAWGGHTCPDLPPRHVRSAQRAEIIKRANAIRAGAHPAPAPKPAPATTAEDEPMLLNPNIGDRVVFSPWNDTAGKPGKPFKNVSLVLAGETGAQLTVTFYRGAEAFPYTHDLKTGVPVAGDPVHGWAGVTMVAVARTDGDLAANASGVLTRW